MLTAEQFAEWKEHPVTKEVFANLKEIRQDVINSFIAGETIGNDAETTQALTTRAVFKIDGLNQILNISFAEEKELKNDSDLVSGY